MKDPIVEEIREVRRQIEHEYQNDPDRYIEHLYRAQKEQGNRLVRRQIKALKKKKVA